MPNSSFLDMTNWNDFYTAADMYQDENFTGISDSSSTVQVILCMQ